MDQQQDNQNVEPPKDSFPDSFYCPLTQELMKDPVVDPEGNSYEREAIEQWLQKNATSPITRSPLAVGELAPNRALRNAIEERIKENGGVVPESHVRKSPPKQPESKEKEKRKQEESVVPKVDGPDSVNLTVSSRKTDADDYVLLSIQPQAGIERTPLDICCVVDVSGSMGTEAKMKNAKGQEEAHGLSVLDIVKHAVKTIVAALHPNDRLALVVYATQARTVFKLTSMSESSKAKVLKEVENLAPEDSTNIWDGLQTGLEILRVESNSSRFKALLLLTDGQANVSPPRGELAMLKKYKDENKHLPGTICTFGFGYDINSELLRDIAIEGDGTYSFIPDSSFVGTAFVNCVSNLFVTMAKNVHLALEPLNGAKFVEVLGGYVHQTTSWGLSINLGSLYYGQSKDVVVRMSIAPDNQPYLTATLKYEARNANAPLEVVVQGTSRDGNDEVNVQRYRLLLVDTVRKAISLVREQNFDEAQAIVKKLIGEMKTSQDKRVLAMVEDLKEQVLQAVSKPDFYQKWGRHYLPSLMCAHLLQQCNNFKDPGVQNYGGKLFQSLRDTVDDLFCKIPPPKPSIKRANVSAPQNMRVYHSSANPCFAGQSLMLMANGTQKKVEHIAKGDRVMTANNKTTEVLCVVKTICKDQKAELVELEGGLLVTPYHPVRVNGKWNFPCDLGHVEERACPAVYSFVVRDEHITFINGIECVTLGHNFQEDVVSHPYFGSKHVVEDLQKRSGWNLGLIEFASGCMIKDSKTGLVCGFREEQSEAAS